MMQERERKRASAISGKRRVKSLAGTAIEPQLPTALAGDDAGAIVLDLDQI
jgi:hypothetical protein